MSGERSSQGFGTSQFPFDYHPTQKIVRLSPLRHRRAIDRDAGSDPAGPGSFTAIQERTRPQVIKSAYRIIALPCVKNNLSRRSS